MGMGKDWGMRREERQYGSWGRGLRTLGSSYSITICFLGILSRGFWAADLEAFLFFISVYGNRDTRNETEME